MSPLKNRCKSIIGFLVFAVITTNVRLSPAARVTSITSTTNKPSLRLRWQEQALITSMWSLCPLIGAYFVYVIDKRKELKLPDASPFYKQHFYAALQAYGIHNYRKYTLKNDSSIKNLGCATSVGAIINEQRLSQLSLAQRIHTCYHEAAHLRLGHVDFNYVEWILLSITCSYLTVRFVHLTMVRTTKWHAMFDIVALAHVIKKGRYYMAQFTIPWSKRKYEKDTDAMAIEACIKSNMDWVNQELLNEYQETYDRWVTFFTTSSEERLKSIHANKLGSLASCKEKQADSLEWLNRWKELLIYVRRKLECDKQRSAQLIACIDRAS